MPVKKIVAFFNKLTLGSISCSIFAIFAGCGSQVKLTSQPEGAQIYLLNQESGEKKKLGETPFTKTSKELTAELGPLGDSSGFASVLFEKEGFESKLLWIPITAAGSIGVEVQVLLKESVQTKVDDENLKTAEGILKKIFLAQQFARTQQFERAFIEIDRVLERFPEFSRALSMKAAIHFAKGELKESLEWYEKALEKDPELSQAVEMAAKIRQGLRLPASERKAP